MCDEIIFHGRVSVIFTAAREAELEQEERK